MQLTLATDRSLIRAAGHSVRYLHCRLQAPPAPTDRTRLPLDLALVLDRSGSMGGAKWACARDTARQMLERLDARDRAALVVYDDHIDTLLELCAVDAGARAQAQRALAAIGPRGTTNLSEGWLTGCGLIGQTSPEERLRRCFLLTDGLANAGITEAAELATHAGALRQLGVVTHTFGVGDDFDEALLGTLADAGGGVFHDLADAERIGPILTRELGDALAVVCAEARVWLHWEADLQVAALGPWRQEADGRALSVWLGDLVSEQEQDLLLAVTFPAGDAEATCPLRVRVTDATGQELASASLHWTWARHSANDRQPRNRDVDRLVAAYHANLARRDAALANRQGDFAQAQQRLKAVARRIRGYAGDDAELNGIVQSLTSDSEVHAAPLAPREAKERYYAAASQTKGRTESGERRRKEGRTVSPDSAKET